MSRITLAHGNGGRLMRELINGLFVKHLGNPILNSNTDAASLSLDQPGKILFTTDSFTVQPLEFPGGDIGSLAVHGTVNDLAVAGAQPHYLALNAIIEEGLEIAQLERIIISLANAAKAAHVQVVTGDTKVVRQGEGSGLYLSTTGIGTRITDNRLSISSIQKGDAILVSGPVGDHGIAVMLAREQFGLKGKLQSDCDNVLPLTEALLPLSGLRFMRDPTRGGLATVMHEINQACALGVSLHEDQISVRDPVNAACEMLGYNPYFLACEGRVVAVIDSQQAQQALSLWQALVAGREAAIIGNINDEHKHVVIKTSLGGEKILPELEQEPLPRIC